MNGCQWLKHAVLAALVLTSIWCQRSFGSGDTQWQPTRRPTQRYEKEITTEDFPSSTTAIVVVSSDNIDYTTLFPRLFRSSGSFQRHPFCCGPGMRDWQLVESEL